MPDELIDADTMARLSAMMRRAPMDRSSAAGMVPSPALPPNPYNTEFPDHIGRPPMPAVYNERFSDLMGAPPQAASLLGPERVLTPGEASQVAEMARSGFAGSPEDLAAYRAINLNNDLSAAGTMLPPARGHVSSLPPRASALPSFRTEHLPPPELYSNWDERPNPRLERISSRGGAYDWQPSGNVSPFGATPDPGRAARVEQLIRDMEEQAALEARLRAMGK